MLCLTPLLYETSKDAQFLKPTVITLAYGLGFGMLLVLLVVPALLAIGHDLGRNLRAARRGVAPRASGARTASFALIVALAGWFAATLGTVLVNGAMPEILGGQSNLPVAFGMFAAGGFAITLVVWGVTALALRRRSAGA